MLQLEWLQLTHSLIHSFKPMPDIVTRGPIRPFVTKMENEDKLNGSNCFLMQEQICKIKTRLKIHKVFQIYNTIKTTEYNNNNNKRTTMEQNTSRLKTMMIMRIIMMLMMIMRLTLKLIMGLMR